MTSATSTPDFPAHPQDGFQIIQDLPDERQLIWTYNKALNQWNSQFIIPKDAATKGWVLEQQYLQAPLTVRDFSKDVATTEYVDGAIAAAIAKLELPEKRKRARNPNGTFRGDDPSTPDINEAWEHE